MTPRAGGKLTFLCRKEYCAEFPWTNNYCLMVTNKDNSREWELVVHLTAVEKQPFNLGLHGKKNVKTKMVRWMCEEVSLRDRKSSSELLIN